MVAIQLARRLQRDGRMELIVPSRNAITSTDWSSRRSTGGRQWGVKVLRYEIKDLTPPGKSCAMQAQITAEREKRGHRDVRRAPAEQINPPPALVPRQLPSPKA
jgi:regulator of protease activity HflC (stomatin/prohibitin superfamily)